MRGAPDVLGRVLYFLWPTRAPSAKAEQILLQELSVQHSGSWVAGLPFWAAMFVALLLGVIALVIAHWREHGRIQKQLWFDLLRDVGIAVVVSVVITGFIELNSHLRHELETQLATRDMIGEDMLGVEVWNELKSTVASNPAFCNRWQLQVNLERPEPGFPEGTLVARSTLTYTLHNRFPEDREIVLSHELESELKATTRAGDAIPRLERLICRPLNSSSATAGFSLNAKELAAPEYWLDDAHFRRSVTLPARPAQGLQITVQRVELVRVPGQYHWYVVWPTKDINVSINASSVPEFDFRLFPRHFNPSRLRPRGSGVWDFDGVMLPGQGLAIVASASSRKL